MGISDAVSSVLGQYANFSGRARRSEFWFWALAVFAASFVVSIVDLVIGNRILTYLLALAVLIPNLAVGARRLHDTGRSGFWQFIGLVPFIGFIVLIIFWAQDSQPANAHGPSPKGIGASGPQYGTAEPGYYS